MGKLSLKLYDIKMLNVLLLNRYKFCELIKNIMYIIHLRNFSFVVLANITIPNIMLDKYYVKE